MHEVAVRVRSTSQRSDDEVEVLARCSVTRLQFDQGIGVLRSLDHGRRKEAKVFDRRCDALEEPEEGHRSRVGTFRVEAGGQRVQHELGKSVDSSYCPQLRSQVIGDQAAGVPASESDVHDPVFLSQLQNQIHHECRGRCGDLIDRTRVRDVYAALRKVECVRDTSLQRESFGRCEGEVPALLSEGEQLIERVGKTIRVFSMSDN